MSHDPFALVVLLVLLPYHAALGGLIEELPGASKADLPRMFTGFLEAAPGQRTFYWLTEAQESPKTAPLLIWMSGGPGASSVSGMLAEHGPFLLNGRSLPKESGRWRLFRNPYSWHLAANLLVWEQPAGVGFSYCEPASACPRPWNDTTSTEANAAIFHAFLRAHPEFQGRDVFIAGESYGGVYVPLLAQALLLPGGAPGVRPARVRGIAVGNVCVGFGVIGGACGPDSMEVLLEFMQGNGAIDGDEASVLRHECGSELRNGSVSSVRNYSKRCRTALRAFGEILGDYNVYNFGSPCGPDGEGNWGSGDAFTCGVDVAVPQYLNDDSVRKAIGTFGIGPRKWQEWDGDGDDYAITMPDVQPAYHALVAAGVDVLVYIGLKDSGGPQFDAADWTRRLGGRIVSKRTWTAGDGHAAGRETVFEKSLRYVTIRGAGHLVPATRPREALAMLRAWLERRDLPKYKGGCQGVWLGLGWGDLCPEDGGEDPTKSPVIV